MSKRTRTFETIGMVRPGVPRIIVLGTLEEIDREIEERTTLKTDEQIDRQHPLDEEAKRLMKVYLQHRTTKNFQAWQRAHEAYLESIFTQVEKREEE